MKVYNLGLMVVGVCEIMRIFVSFVVVDSIR